MTARMISFIFGPPYRRSPVQMSCWPSYIHPATRDRIKAALETGCRCRHDAERTATLVQRNGAAWLQCDTCGDSLGSAMPRKDHQGYSAYPQWREDLRTEYRRQDDAHTASIIAARAEASAAFPILTAEERDEQYRQRSLEYAEWCHTSPEWAAIKKKILWRSRGICEACLTGNAEIVHHLTYAFGKLPPAWHLRAVCMDCHTRLHDAEDDWCDCGMARGKK